MLKLWIKLEADETNPVRLEVGRGGSYGIEASNFIESWGQQEGNIADPIESNGGTTIQNGRSEQNDDGSIDMEIFNQQFKEEGGQAEDKMKAYGFIAAVDDGDVKAGDILERGEGFFEAIVPMLQDAHNHMQQNLDGIKENFAANKAPLPDNFHFMNMSKKGIERYPAASNALLSWAIDEINKGVPSERRLQPVFDPTAGTLLAGKKENPTLTTADIAGVINEIENVDTNINQGIEETLNAGELDAYDNQLSQVDASALGILERLGVSAPIPQDTDSDEQAAEGKTSQQKRIDNFRKLSFEC